MAGDAASDLEEHAARGQLDGARPLVERLESMARGLGRQVDGLSIEVLQRRAGAADDPDRSAEARHGGPVP